MNLLNMKFINSQLNFEMKRFKEVINGNINNKEKALLFNGLLFVFWFFSLGKACPCDGNKNKEKCYRFEVNGVQVNHLYYFFILGYFFHEYFFIIQIFGIVWELVEYYIDKNKKLLKNIGGCLDNKPKKKNWHSNYLIYAGKEKKYNIIDKIFGIKNSTVHGWHHSYAEIVANIIGFMIGAYFKHINILFIVLLMILVIFLDF